MLSCTVKIIKDKEEVFKNSASKLTKIYQNGLKLPKKGQCIGKNPIIQIKSDDNHIYIHI
jgi:hypothetical protein